MISHIQSDTYKTASTTFFRSNALLKNPRPHPNEKKGEKKKRFGKVSNSQKSLEGKFHLKSMSGGTRMRTRRRKETVQQ